jgi:hypothetical protein
MSGEVDRHDESRERLLLNRSLTVIVSAKAGFGPQERSSGEGNPHG